jgi:peroxiredoxin
MSLPVKLDHCVIHVSDWERSNAFYRDVIGAQVVPRGAGFAYRFGDCQLNCHGPGVKADPVARFPANPATATSASNGTDQSPMRSLISPASRLRSSSAPSNATAPRDGAPASISRSRRVADGIHVVPVEGPLMTTTHNPNILPADLPAPQDDGAARHLQGLTLPSLKLQATDGSEVDLAALVGRTVAYIYPRTGRPGQPLPDGWDAIPGARGCTPQSCSFRDHFAELRQLGVSHLYGISTQDTDYQREAAERLHLPFPLISDADLRFTEALRLPTFVVDGMTLIKRMVLVIDDGVIAKVFYPVFPPDESAGAVVAWLRSSR